MLVDPSATTRFFAATKTGVQMAVLWVDRRVAWLVSTEAIWLPLREQKLVVVLVVQKADVLVVQ